MKKLTLPKPATDLWTPARDIIHEIPTPEEAPHTIRPHIAGGSALAARWNHRSSTDIDIIFPDRESLTDVIENDPRNILQRLGGTPNVISHRQIVIDFPNGAIDLAAIDPQPRLGQRDHIVDGRIETVLSTAQILRGKLERAHDLNARDIFDVAVAAREDPAALATALNMLPEQRTSAIAWAWHQSEAEIRDRYAADELLWTSPDHRIEPHQLTDQAVHALYTHRYQRVQVDVDGPDITIVKTIQTGTLPVETYNRSDPAAALTEAGLTAHLAEAGPVRPAQLASAIEKSTTSMNILDTTGRGLTMPTSDQLAPPAAERSRQHTRERDP
ncbi:MAG: nucleotidyl transferase AbiEii/AbiGii toxin family protein [Chromatiales bacterium]|nr:nucleotidyl transferase AbiEii/AbiGii toxin family protein [Chromatiales bacterium]